MNIKEERLEANKKLYEQTAECQENQFLFQFQTHSKIERMWGWEYRDKQGESDIV